MSSALLRLVGVSRDYVGPPPVRALVEVDIEIGKQDFIAVTGPSGSGKSTLLNVLGLLDLPTGGRYLIQGQDIGELSAREVDRLRGRAFGFVFQSSHMLADRTVAANVALALRVRGIERRLRPDLVAAALDQVGLLPRARARAGDLSGGERQRAAIARAVVARPDIVLADEPTGNLDADNANKVLGILHALHRSGLTVVVITHNADVAHQASRQIQLTDGRVRP